MLKKHFLQFTAKALFCCCPAGQSFSDNKCLHGLLQIMLEDDELCAGSATACRLTQHTFRCVINVQCKRGPQSVFALLQLQYAVQPQAEVVGKV